ncbi:MAG: energy transducer TonB [Candidatus Accumulibacter sp.]|jgi:protein TonB|nr:energy transducer TonB [Accumulibacter sp.]
MFDVHDSKPISLLWVGVALFLHGALLFALSGGKARTTAPFSLPIQVSLLDPAPISAAPALAEPAPVIAPPEPPPPKPIPRPVVKPPPKPKPVPQPRDTPAPLSDLPTVDPVPVAVAEEAVFFVPASGSTQATDGAAFTIGGAAAHSGPTAGGGDALVEARFDAAYLRNPKPSYPPMSKRLREEGKVMLRVHVLADGNAGQVEIKQSSGSARLDEAARIAVHRWRFVPARRRNEAVDAWVVVPISFNLES